MVGNGIPKLVERFAPAGTDQPTLDQAFEEFMAWYGVHKEDKTAPYPGMNEAALRLKEAGCPSRCCPTRPTRWPGRWWSTTTPGCSPGAGGPLRRPHQAGPYPPL